MTPGNQDPFQALIREAGEGWIIDWFSPRNEAVGHLRKLLREADKLAANRARDFLGGAQQITEQRLAAMYKRSPHSAQAFLQALGETRCPEMLVMAWQILEGMGIADVKMEYFQNKSFNLAVKLVSPNDGHVEAYSSSNINDAVLVRHFGIATMDNRPVFDGFYALRYER